MQFYAIQFQSNKLPSAIDCYSEIAEDICTDPPISLLFTMRTTDVASEFL